MYNYDSPAPKKSRIKPKVVREWEEDDITKLISLVERHECLWDAADAGYHNKVLRRSAWQNIFDNFDEKYTIADLNAKWTNLRIQYRGYIGRAKTKSGQGVTDTPKWRFFNVMSFVGRAKDHHQTQQLVSNNSFCNDASEYNSSDQSESFSEPSLPRRKRTKTTPCEVQSTVATQIAEAMREAISAISEQSQSVTDPNWTFANYLHSELKTLTRDAAASVRKKVTIFFLDCVDEERAKERQRQSVRQSFSS